MVELFKTRKFLRVLSLVAVLAIFVGIGFVLYQRSTFKATTQEQPAVKTYELQVKAIDELSSSLLTSLQQYRNTKSERQTQVVNEMIEKAVKREQLLANLIASSEESELVVGNDGINKPISLAAKLVFPTEIQKSLSEVPGISKHIEQDVNITGSYGEVVTEYSDRPAKYHYYIESTDGGSTLLYLAVKPLFSSGSIVVAKGQMVKGLVVIPGDTHELLAANILVQKNNSELEGQIGAESEISISTSPTTTVAPAVTKNVAVLLVNFANDRSEPLAKTQVNELFFEGERSVRSWFDEVSKGRVSISGAVLGYYSLTINRPANCSISSMNAVANAAIPLARAEIGRNFSVHQWGIIFPAFSGPECSWNGRADSAKQRFFISANSSTQLNFTNLAVHEMGHNFGLSHSSGQYCFDGQSRMIRYSETASCTLSDQYDQNDNMGNNNGRHFSAVSNEFLGWLPVSQVRTVAASGTYTILPSNKSGSGFRAIRIPISSDPVNDYWISVEYRRRSGVFDDYINSNIEGINGLLIRKVSQDKKTRRVFREVLYAGTPGERYDADLPVNDELYLSRTGLIIKTVSISEESATVEVVFNPTCTVRPPSISALPASATVYPGSDMLRTFNISIRNNNNSVCAASNFSSTVSVIGQAGLQTTVTPPVQPINAGKTGTATLEAAGSRGTPFGRYVIKVQTVDSLEPTSTTNVEVVYWVGL